tara:strand:+ start:2477 stop:2893 length:417 start_codon:yes stop_codon:yes gene_type:complete
MIAALLPVLGPLVGDVVKRILPEDKDKRMEIERELNMAIMQNGAAIEQAAASVIKAEAQSEHKITATWRPILMLSITAIVTWNYLLAPLVELAVRMFAGDQVPLSIPLPEELWNLLMIGVGGYVVGRSGEKIAKNIKK